MTSRLRQSCVAIVLRVLGRGRGASLSRRRRARNVSTRPRYCRIHSRAEKTNKTIIRTHPSRSYAFARPSSRVCATTTTSRCGGTRERSWHVRRAARPSFEFKDDRVEISRRVHLPPGWSDFGDRLSTGQWS